jgi:hypothetical protein
MGKNKLVKQRLTNLIVPELFKAGFKEARERADMYQKGMSLKNSVDKLRELLKDYSNENPLIIKSKDGEEARLGRSSIGKLVSNKKAWGYVRRGTR